MALSIIAFAYGIAARFRNDDGEISKLKACIAYLEAENSRLLDRLSVRLDELNDLKRQLAEARIETRLQAQPLANRYAALGIELPCDVRNTLYAQAAFAHPWTREIAECAGGGRARYFKRTVGGA